MLRSSGRELRFMDLMESRLTIRGVEEQGLLSSAKVGHVLSYSVQRLVGQSAIL